MQDIIASSSCPDGEDQLPTKCSKIEIAFLRLPLLATRDQKQALTSNSLFVRLQEVRASLQASLRVKGLLEMMFEVLSNWIDAFIEDVEEVEEGEAGRGTPEGATTPRGSGGPGTSPASSGPLPNRREAECLLLQG